MANEQLLKAFGANVQQLINRENLSREETYTMFCQVLANEQPDLQQGAFLAALVSKGETVEEIAGAWQAIIEKDTVEVFLDVDEPVIENSGTGMDSLKTFNVSSAAAIVAAACGAKMARHGSRALTSFCGTVDILEAVGLDVECDAQAVVQSIQDVGIGLFNGMSPKIHPFGLGRILSQIRFGTTLNIAASLANPARPTHALRGVYTESLIAPVAEVMASIGYHRGLVVHGKVADQRGGVDELSVCGPTVVCEFTGNGDVKEYVLQPEDLGMIKVPFSEIASLGNLQKERKRFLTVLSGKGEKGCIDFTCLNAGATLYAGELVKSIEEGVHLASAAIADGSALAKLKEWVTVQARDEGGIARLEEELAAL